jgi:DNA-binding NarL/FixJ family response regulator
MSTYDSWEIAELALDTGASGYVVKVDARNELANAVEAAFQGRPYISSGLKDTLLFPEDTQAQTASGAMRVWYRHQDRLD